MAQLPSTTGMTITVDDVNAARRFYTGLYQHDEVLEAEFAGLKFISLKRDGEVLVNIFPKVEGNPLAAVVPALMVDSVAAYEAKVKELGGSVLIPSDACPANGAPFAVCVDVTGNQILIREPKSK